MAPGNSISVNFSSDTKKKSRKMPNTTTMISFLFLSPLPTFSMASDPIFIVPLLLYSSPSHIPRQYSIFQFTFSSAIPSRRSYQFEISVLL
mmetsp:Transcript_8186/g.12245  ORF Transcript_8186/g.12245 Transcript_8186/m.12245 type:complete len:91 (-) Transcript_8186:7-279(-)